MYNPKLNPMKALKITLLLALFVSVSSQTDKKPAQESVDTYETTHTYDDVLAHQRDKVTVPDQA